MPDMDGIALAKEIRQMRMEMSVIFLTASSEYALDAFAVHADGYLLKPVNWEKLAAEVAYALVRKTGRVYAHITARTFGNFDFFVDGEPVTFRQAKCKELLAYLIDRQGGSVTRAEAFAILWEDRMYDRPMQKQLDVIIRSLRETLEAYHIGWIFELKSGTLRVVPDKISCDAWRFFSGDVDALNEYQGEYMNTYSWANMKEAYLDRITENRK